MTNRNPSRLPLAAGCGPRAAACAFLQVVPRHRQMLRTVPSAPQVLGAHFSGAVITMLFYVGALTDVKGNVCVRIAQKAVNDVQGMLSASVSLLVSVSLRQACVPLRARMLPVGTGRCSGAVLGAGANTPRGPPRGRGCGVRCADPSSSLPSHPSPESIPSRCPAAVFFPPVLEEELLLE